MGKLRSFICVDFLGSKEANNALAAVQSKFFSKTPNSINFNKVEGNRVYIVKTDDILFDSRVRKFLSGLDGVAPVGYRFD